MVPTLVGVLRSAETAAEAHKDGPRVHVAHGGVGDGDIFK